MIPVGKIRARKLHPWFAPRSNAESQSNYKNTKVGNLVERDQRTSAPTKSTLVNT